MARPLLKQLDFLAPDAPTEIDPIEILRHEHGEFRHVCDLIDRLAQDHYHDRAVVDAALAHSYLSRDLPLHLANEEGSLFPLLRRRCRQQDGIEDLLPLLSAEHQFVADGSRDLLVHLADLAAGKQIREPMSFILPALTFTENQRRHSAWENATIFRLADKRLSKQDKADLAREMIERREPAKAVPA
jgi:hemerythrin-like domain-containing protein